MSQHLSEKEIGRYRDRQLSPNEILALDDHLAHCRLCQVEIGNDATALAEITTALQAETDFEEGHLPYWQMAEYVDDVLTDVDREIAANHLAFCSNCKAEVQDLLMMKTTLVALPGRESSPREPAGLWTRLATFWQVPAIRIAGQSAAAVVLVTAIIWVAVLYSRRHSEEARTRNSPQDQAVTSNSGSSPPERVGAKNPPSPPSDQKDAQRLVDLADGNGHVALDSNDKLSGLESAPLQIQNEVRSALKTEHVNGPQFLATLKGESGKLMGAGRTDYGLRSPVATAVESATPTFRWNAVEGAENYTVTIYDTGSKKVLTSGPVLRNIWKAGSALERGRTYSWQVRAVKEGREVLLPPPAAPDARFRIIAANKLQEIQLARKGHAKSHLVLGVVLAEAGVLDEAERELQKLLDANPKSPIARSLLRSVKALRR